MDDHDIKMVVEALLMSSDKPLSVEQICSAFEEWQKPDKSALDRAFQALDEDYKERAIELKQLASGYIIQTREKFGVFISRLQTEKSGRYSRALLETLAIIAYRQPVTRADIEDIRGVAVSSSILKTLQERDWIKVAGHRDVPGKPAVYVTTRTFLDYFNLTSINQLPPLPATSEPVPVVSEQSIEEYIV